MTETIRDWAIKTQTEALISRATNFNPTRLCAAWDVPEARLAAQAGRQVSDLSAEDMGI